MTIKERAQEAGVSVATILKRIQQRKDDELLRKAKNEIREESAGWNPRAGCRKKHKGY